MKLRSRIIQDQSRNQGQTEKERPILEHQQNPVRNKKQKREKAPLTQRVHPETLHPIQKVANQTNNIDKAADLLKELYENIDSKVSYTRALDAFIKRNDVYSKFKPSRRRFNRRKTNVHGPFNTYQIDLSDYRAIRHSNKNFGWILFIIDAFSRYGYCIPLKHKTSSETHDALEKWLLSLNHLPKFIYSDRGKEFLGSSVQKLFRKRGITHYVLTGAHKASIVERFQRTIKTSLEMYFYKTQRKKWIDVIGKVVTNYNNRYHRSIKMAPSKVTYANFEEVYKMLHPRNSTRRLCRLSVGDTVRIAIEKKEFAKGYHQTFSNELYNIKKVVNYNGVCLYTVESIKDGSTLRKYYHQLSLVVKNDSNTT